MLLQRVLTLAPPKDTGSPGIQIIKGCWKAVAGKEVGGGGGGGGISVVVKGP